MRVLIVGSGGREHALAWRLEQSSSVTGLWVAGGNAGTAEVATNVDVNPEDVLAVVETARSLTIDLVVVGPEVPLAAGIVDELDSLGIPAFGPSRAAAQLESSKGFARAAMAQASVPGPEYHTFDDYEGALSFVKKNRAPVVVKANGLAAGKGVSLCYTSEEAAAAVRRCMLDRAFGSAGDTIVIEEMLQGREVSVFAFTDGERMSPVVAACDYKRVGDGDEGPNTGGMGSFSPPDFWSDELARDLAESIIAPTIQAMADRNTPYRGVLYAGIMLTDSGPRVLEFNCRFGDPEAQVILPLLESDPIDVMLACIEGRLSHTPVIWNDDPHVAVIMASAGYPDAYDTGFPISGLEHEDAHSLVFHAGTQLVSQVGEPQTVTVTSGGRVLAVVGRGDTRPQARDRAYSRVDTIGFHGAYYRTDIAKTVGAAGVGK